MVEEEIKDRKNYSKRKAKKNRNKNRTLTLVTEIYPAEIIIKDY
jgi:hypothetical protein